MGSVKVVVRLEEMDSNKCFMYLIMELKPNGKFQTGAFPETFLY